MKKMSILGPILAVLTVAFIVIFRLSDKDRHEEDLYRNRAGVIVEYGSDQAFTNDKFHTPVSCGNVLVRDIEDTTLYLELSTCDSRRIIDKEWYYNHEVGDIVHFTYIRKDRYFRIE